MGLRQHDRLIPDELVRCDWVGSQLYLNLDTGGKVEGVAAIMRDVSKRWERDRKMIEELRELKRERA